MAKTITLKYVGPSAAVSIPGSPEFMVRKGEPFEVDGDLGEALLLAGCEVERDESGAVVKTTPTPAAPFKKTTKKGSSE